MTSQPDTEKSGWILLHEAPRSTNEVGLILEDVTDFMAVPGGRLIRNTIYEYSRQSTAISTVATSLVFVPDPIV